MENGWRALFTRTSDLVQRLQVARCEPALKAAINRLDRFDLLTLDDLASVSKDQAETSVLFEPISARHERRSTLISEANVDSYRRRAALERKTKGAGQPQSYPTTKNLDPRGHA